MCILESKYCDINSKDNYRYSCVWYLFMNKLQLFFMKKTKVLLFLVVTFLTAVPSVAQNQNDHDVITKHALDARYGNRVKSNDFITGSKQQGMTLMRTPMALKKNHAVAKHSVHRATATVFEAGWNNSLTTQEEFDQFTVIDANNDGKTWIFNSYEDQEGGYSGYSYSQTENADDWLVSPGISLKGGKTYYLNFKTRCVQSNYPERMEVKMGTEATADGMKVSLLPATDISNVEFEEYQLTVKPEEDGVYYFGFHAVSDAFMYFLYLQDVSVETAPEPKSPSAVTDVVITPDMNAALNASISFTCPATAFDGSQLTSLTGVRILRNSEQIADEQTVMIGAQHTYADTAIPQSGISTYTLIPYNEFGDGTPTVVSGYIGLDLPTAPENAQLTNNPDNIMMLWEPSTAAHGGAFKPNDVIYDIYSLTYNNYGEPVLKDLITSTNKGVTQIELGFGADEGEPGELELAVGARNDAGASESAAITNRVLLGVPQTIPFIESFANGKAASLLLPYAAGTGVSYGYAGPGMTADEDANGDGGSAFLQTLSNDKVGFSTFKLSLAAANQPKLVFNLKNTASMGTFRVFVTNAEGEETVLDEKELAGLAEGEWQVCKYDMSQFVNERYIQVNFEMYEMSGGFNQNTLFIDNIFIGELPEKDLAVSVSASKKVERGQSATVKICVNNTGDKVIEAYKVAIKAGDEIVEEKTINEPISSFCYNLIEATVPTSLLYVNDELAISVKVSADGDDVEENNEATAIVSLVNPEVSSVENLTSDKTDGKVILTWQKPSPLMPKTESFEDYDNWTYENIGSWKLVDGDGGRTGGDFVYNSSGEVTYENQGTPFAYIVFNEHNFGGYDLPEKGINSFAAHSGDQFMASVWASNYDFMSGQFVNTDNDDWMISPELPGAAQTISFWANNMVANVIQDGSTKDMVQKVEVLYSATNNEIDSFTAVGEPYEISGGKWQEVQADLPEGAKYFAIRNITSADNAFILMVDDVAYAINGGDAKAYRIYRDGELIGETTSLTFIDEDPKENSHVYQVTAIFDGDIESAPATITVDDILAINIATFNSENKDVEVYDLNGRRVTPAQKGVYIFNGKKVVIK